MVILIVVGLSILPEEFISGGKIKPINILSDIVSREQLRAAFGFDARLSGEVAVTDGDSLDNISSDSIMTPDSEKVTQRTQLIYPDSIVPIEDYSADSRSMILFFESLMKAQGGSMARIAVMGDSFIEGDILTADLRLMYQNKYGGLGVGFVPFYSQVAGFRQTIKHKATGWTTLSTVKDNSSDFILSNYIFTASEAATSEYSIGKFNNKKASVGRAVLVFKNVNSTHISADVNSKGATLLAIDVDSVKIQTAIIEDTIRTLNLSFSNTRGFMGYGVYFDDKQGVYVDNYSVRGSSGVTLVKMNAEMCRELNQKVPTNLIILQYGLNTVVDNSANFKYYKINMIKAVNKVKEAYPKVPILMLGVSQQSVKRDGAYVINPSVELLENIQREIAKETKVAYWSINSAMSLNGGIVAFVKSGFASKDFTHINVKGGAKVANELFKSLEYYKLKTVGDMKWDEYLNGFSVVKDENMIEEEMVEIVENETDNK